MLALTCNSILINEKYIAVHVHFLLALFIKFFHNKNIILQIFFWLNEYLNTQKLIHHDQLIFNYVQQSIFELKGISSSTMNMPCPWAIMNPSTKGSLVQSLVRSAKENVNVKSLQGHRKQLQRQRNIYTYLLKLLANMSY